MHRIHVLVVFCSCFPLVHGLVAGQCQWLTLIQMSQVRSPLTRSPQRFHPTPFSWSRLMWQSSRLTHITSARGKLKIQKLVLVNVGGYYFIYNDKKTYKFRVQQANKYETKRWSWYSLCLRKYINTSGIIILHHQYKRQSSYEKRVAYFSSSLSHRTNLHATGQRHANNKF